MAPSAPTASEKQVNPESPAKPIVSESESSPAVSDLGQVEPAGVQSVSAGVLSGSISIKMKPVVAPVRPKMGTNTVPLTQERLQETWNAMLEQWESAKPEMYGVLHGHAVHLVENNLFTIEATNSNFERDLRPVQMPMLEYLRAQLSCPALQCRVIVRVEQRESKVYQPSETYEAMLQTNAALAKMRMVFSELDY